MAGPFSIRANRWLVAAVLLMTAVSGIRPKDYATWFFELVVGAIGIAVLVGLSGRFRFSNFIYLVVGLHYLVLALGAHYTYAEMPLFDRLREAWDLSRNHFDRVGHFAQGVTPALITREALRRGTRLGKSRWVPLLAVSVALAFSALYEILEWGWVMVFYPGRGAEWLGLQGDEWDAQADMLAALLGAFFAVTVCAPLHERSMRALSS